MKKLVSTLLVLIVAASGIMTLSACGRKSVSLNAGVKEEVEYSYKYDDMEATEDSVAPENSTSASGTDVSTKNNTVSTNRKIIETIDLTLQTKEFDKLIDKINAKVSELGGYIEASEVDGREIGSYNSRWAEITARIPSKKSGKFGDYISKNSVVVSRAVSTEDVTLQYVDNESRVKALEAEKKSLEKLLENAASVEDIISVRSQLTNVIYEIETLKSQLRTYDNLVDYTTVNITVNEVERTEIVEKQSVWQEIGNNLKNNFGDMWAAVVTAFVFVVSAIPFLAPIGIVVGSIIVIIRVKDKRKTNKNTTPQENNK